MKTFLFSFVSVLTKNTVRQKKIKQTFDLIDKGHKKLINRVFLLKDRPIFQNANQCSGTLCSIPHEQCRTGIVIHCLRQLFKVFSVNIQRVLGCKRKGSIGVIFCSVRQLNDQLFTQAPYEIRLSTWIHAKGY